MTFPRFFTAGIIIFHLIGYGSFICFGQTAAKPQKGYLFVKTNPQSARVRVLNIRPKFYQGMKLDPGKYHVEVSSPGYVMVKKWVAVVAGGEKKITIQLLPTPAKITHDDIPTYPGLAEPHIKRGAAHYASGRYNDAIDAFKQAIRIDPGNAKAHVLLGGAYVELDRYEDATRVYRQAIRIDPDYADAHYYLGIAYDKLDLLEDAVSALKQAIRIDPDDSDAHFNLGVAYGKLGLLEDAASEFIQAIRIDPNYAAAHFNLGVVCNGMEKTALAVEEYKTLKRLDPERAEQLFNEIYK